jgi:hypothetical protein
MVKSVSRQLPAWFESYLHNIYNVFVMLNVIGASRSALLSYSFNFHLPLEHLYHVFHNTTLLQSYHPHHFVYGKGHVMSDVESK